MRKILLSAIFTVIFVMPLITQAAISSNQYVTRAQLVKILRKEKPESNIFGTKLLRPRDKVTLAEAAVFITNAFELPKPENFSGDWFETSLLALESKGAIPTSIFTVMEKLTRAEVLEIIDRLKNNVTDRPSMTFQSLVHPRYIGSQRVDFWRPGVSAMNEKLFRLLKQPAYYQIFDVRAEEQEDNAYCQRYASEKIIIIHSEGEDAVVPQNFEVTFVGKSTDYCDAGNANPYQLTIIKEGDFLRLVGSLSNRVKIVRTELEKIPYEWGPSGPFYEQTRVNTDGTLETKTLENGEPLFIYRTAWQSIFNDLRGTPFFMAAKKLPDGRMWMKFYEGPLHNRDFYGYGNLSYEKCLVDPKPFLFCIKKEGGNLIVASRLELGDRLTLWIDEHFKR